MSVFYKTGLPLIKNGHELLAQGIFSKQFQIPSTSSGALNIKLFKAIAAWVFA